MKKLLSLLLTAAMLCSMLAVFAVPAAAYTTNEINGELYYYITDGDELYSVLHYLTTSQPAHIVIGRESITVKRPLEVISKVNVIFETAKGIDRCTINYNSAGDSDDESMMTIGANGKDADGAVLLFADNITITAQNNEDDGGAICVDADDVIIKGAHFKSCRADGYGGAICVTGNNILVWRCVFYDCYSDGFGGAIAFNPDMAIQYTANVGDSSFFGCSDDYGRNDIYGLGRAGWVKVGGYVTDIPDHDGLKNDVGIYPDSYWSDVARPELETRIPNIKVSDPPVEMYDPPYQRPITDYARITTQGRNDCDAIHPDIVNKSESDKKLFTIEGKNAYGFLWEVTYQDALTIKAKDGYTITRIEAVMQDKDNYDSLSIDNGTKEKAVRDPYYSGNWIAKFDDINAKSVTLTTKGNIYNWETVYFKDFIIYYTKDSTLGSVFSGGTLWLIIGVAAVAVAAAVVIVVVKKKKKPVTANGATAENSEE